MFFAVSGQSHFQLDSASKSVVNKRAFKLSSKANTDDVYTLAQQWFNQTGKFSQKNADPPIDTVKAKKNKNKIEVDKEFANTTPLQMLNPAAGKVVGSGVLKYYGGIGNSIKLLYIKYDIYVEIKTGLAIVSATNLRYYHFSPRNYTTTGLYSLQGGRPCDAEGTINDLVNCENFHDEFKNLATCYNKEVNNLFTDFKSLLSQKKVLYDPKAATASKGSKPAAKKPVKKK